MFLVVTSMTKEGYVFGSAVCLSVCLFVDNITQKVTSLLTVGNMGVMKCLGQRRVRSQSASSLYNIIISG